MKNVNTLAIVFTLLFICTGNANAQFVARNNSIGFNAGALGYTGRYSIDAPIGSFTSFFGSFTYRHRLTSKLFLRGEVLGGQLKGNNLDVESQIGKPQGEFQTGIGEVSLKAEYDFIDLHTHKVSPFVNVGAGGYMLFGYSSTESDKSGGELIGFTMPVGLGVKYKLNNRTKLLAEGSARLFARNLDGREGEGINNPNKYFGVGIGIIYELRRPNELW